MFEKVKDVGLEIYLKNHPLIAKLKKDAKSLKKELINQNVQLMKCQDIIARQQGFSDWFNLYNFIKKQYQKDWNNIPFKLTKEIINNNEDFLLGYDPFINRYKWHDKKSLRVGVMISGENIYRKYDTSLMLQSIEKGDGVIILNGDNDQETLEIIKKKAKETSRENDLVILDDNSDSLKFSDSLECYSGGIAILIFSCVKEMGENEDAYKGGVLSLLSIICMYLGYRRDICGEILTLKKIKDYISESSISNLTKDLEKDNSNSVPEHIKSSLISYMENVSEEMKKLHINKILNSLDSILGANLFTDNNSNLKINEWMNNKNKIYLINTQNKLKQSLISSCIQIFIASELGRPIEDIKKSKIDSAKIKGMGLYFRNWEIINGFAVVPAQLRALGNYWCFSFKNLENVKRISKGETLSISANCNTKILSSKELKNNMNFIGKIDENQLKLINGTDEDSNSSTNSAWLLKNLDISKIELK